MPDDLLQRLQAILAQANQTRADTQQWLNTPDNIDKSLGELTASYSEISESLRGWVAIAVSADAILRAECIRQDDAEIALSWSYVAKRADLATAVNSTLSGVDWSQYGASLSIVSAAKLFPSGSMGYGPSLAAITSVIICSVGLKLSLLGEDYDLVLQVPLTFRITEDQMVVIETVGHSRLLSDAFWKLGSAAAIAKQICDSTDANLGNSLKDCSRSSRYAYDLGEVNGAMDGSERHNIVVTVLSMRPEQFLRISVRVWVKTTAYRIDGTPNWIPMPSGSAPANPRPQDPKVPNPRLQSMPDWADMALKLTTAYVLGELWNHVVLRANEPYLHAMPPQNIWIPWGRWGVAPDPSDGNRIKMYWGAEYNRTDANCASGAWRWYDWHIHYECDRWEIGQTSVDVNIYLDLAVVPIQGKVALSIVISVLGNILPLDPSHPDGTPTGIEAQRIEATAGQPFSIVNISF
jgi:hypothetical protein